MSRTDSSGSACPAPAELLRFTSGDLPARRVAAIQRHLASCDTCRSALQETARALYTYRAHMQELTADEGPRFESFRTALAAQDETLQPRSAPAGATVRTRAPFAVMPLRRWSWAAAAAMLVISTVIWYRYTEVPLSAETILTRAITHEEQSRAHLTSLSSSLPSSPAQSRHAASIAFRRIADDAARLRLRGASAGTSAPVLTSDPAEIKRSLESRLAQYGFSAGSPLSAAHFQRWRQQIKRRDDRVLELPNDLIKVSTVNADADAAIREGEIVVRRESFEPIAQTWRFADGFEAEVSRVADGAPGVMPLPSPGESDAPASALDRVASAAASSSPGGADASLDLELIEIETRAALHRLGVPGDGGAIGYKQTGDRVVITGTLPTTELVVAVSSHAENHAHVDTRVRIGVPVRSASTAEADADAETFIAHAPAFQTWLEDVFRDDAQQRARFVPRAGDLTAQLRDEIGGLSALGQRYSPERMARLSGEARANVRALAATQYHEVAAAHDALVRHLSPLIKSASAASSSSPSPSSSPEGGDLPNDWQALASALASSIDRLRGGVTQLLNRAELQTTEELRDAAEEALRPSLAELAGSLRASANRR